MEKIIINNLNDGKKLAYQIAHSLRGGEVIGLIGDLGAGKTTFTQFLAKALGVNKSVSSPTFNVIKIYSINEDKTVAHFDKKYLGKKRLIHIDAYRLHSPDELVAMGIEEYFNDKNYITIIEWADKIKQLLPKRTIFIKIKVLKNQTDRTFQIAG